jgi:hypothetical protein
MILPEFSLLPVSLYSALLANKTLGAIFPSQGSGPAGCTDY